MTVYIQPVLEFSFLCLPVEIQHKICCLFCRHCQNGASPSVLLSAPVDIGFRTLKSLSEICHSLNRIAQPILYHYPDIKIYTAFFKTVTMCPKLAASVKVLARLYEADWNPLRPGLRPYSRADIAYLIQLGQRLNVTDDGRGPEDMVMDLGAKDDANFMRCFEYLVNSPDKDDEGNMRAMSYAAYYSLLTALQFAILPKLEFAMLDLDDGRAWLRHRLLSSGQLLFEYPYLKKTIANSPEHFSHLHTIVFRNTFHYREDSLGLESISYLLNAIPNIRIVSFDLLRGTKPDEYQETDSFSAPDLDWIAIPQLQEAYFDPCVRPDGPAPMIAIRNMLQRCTQLKKLIYRHKFPDQYNPTLFSPSRLFEAISSIHCTLEHLELYCSSAKIPTFASEQLLDHRLKDFTKLKTLALDEELFCRHWIKDTCLHADACLVDILPETVTALTIQLHDKFKAVPDIIRLGGDAALGRYPHLSRLAVRVLHDTTSPNDRFNMNRIEAAFDTEYLLHATPPKEWEERLRRLADRIRPDIIASFQDANVVVDVRYVYEKQFSILRSPFH